MKYIVRNGMFETNSSMTHCLVIDTAENFEKWKNGELIYSWEDGGLIPFDSLTEEDKSGLEWNGFLTYKKYGEDFYTKRGAFTTPSGDEVRWRAYYGHD